MTEEKRDSNSNVAKVNGFDLLWDFLHELNSPVTAIHGFCQLILQEEVLDNPTKDGLRAIKDDTQHIQRAANSISNKLSLLTEYASAIEGRTRPQIKPFDLNSVIYEVLDDMGSDEGQVSFKTTKQGRIRLPLTYNGKPHIRKQRPRYVSGDPYLSRIVVTNLFSNACKYGKTHVDLKIRTRKEYVDLVVSNDCETIPPEHREHLFDLNFRVPGNKVDGSGIGLFVARRMAESQGGALTFEALDGEARFRYRLPRGYLNEANKN